VIPVISRRSFPVSINNQVFAFHVVQSGHFKKPEFFVAFLSVGCLLPEDSILKERLELFQLIE
jgi:hypothetical protein